MTMSLLLCFVALATLVRAAGPTPSDPGWILVRRQSSTSIFHPAIDNALGTQSYGTPVGEAAAGTFSVNFEDVVPFFDQMLFITGDRSRWIVMDKAEVAKRGGVALTTAPFNVLSSYLDPNSHSIEMLNRVNGEDPWLSARDHFTAITTEDLLYGEASYSVPSHLASLTRGGLNVFIRKVFVGVPGPTPSDPGWTLVRRQSSTLNFHPATDNALGTQAYGTPVGEAAVGTFSLLFEQAVPLWNQALFITGDRSRWIVMEKTEVARNGGGNIASFTVLSSYRNPNSHQLLMFNRPNAEDPWFSARDHFAAITTQDLLYGEASFPGFPLSGHLLSLSRGGLNVFIRNSVVGGTE